jgi:uncharacterized repeat protein (TIGR01451 family)
MKRRTSIALGLLATAAAVPFVTSTPVLANLQEAGAAIAKVFEPQVKLVMGAEKQITITNPEGKQEKAWTQLKGNVTVQPGDVLRYTTVSENAGDKAATDLVVTQPIPARTTYILSSARANGADLTFSIDRGQTFSAKPMVKVKQPDGSIKLEPAPAKAYTHVRWDYSQSLAPMATVRAAYEVAVR